MLRFFVKSVIIFLLFVSHLIFSGCSPSSPRGQQEDTENMPAIQYSQEIKNILNKKMKFVKELVSLPMIERAIVRANKINTGIAMKDILERDQQWIQTQGMNDELMKFIDKSCSEQLIEFQNEYDGFVEIFITDRRGLNVCQTNKTSDYYQMDEDWWMKTYHNGRGLDHYSQIEYDVSAQFDAISLYVPVIHSDTGNLVGIGKAVVSISQIKEEL